MHNNNSYYYICTYPKKISATPPTQETGNIPASR